jgi:molybdopterin-guanine dinucleotide biosynthesis protein A
MPFVTREQLRFLCSEAAEGCGVVPLIRERVEPFAAIYPREAAPDFNAALAGPDFSLQPIIRELASGGLVRMFPVPREDERFYRSINTPDDVQEFLA